MLVENTPSYALASGLLGHHKNTIGFVGYCDPDTPGGKLLMTKPGDDFLFETAHVRARVQADPRAIVLTHGDPEARAWFAKEIETRASGTKVLDPTPGEYYQV